MNLDYQQNFFSGVYGIDSAYLEEINQSLDSPVDLAAFEKGDILLLREMVDDGGGELLLICISARMC